MRLSHQGLCVATLVAAAVGVPARVGAADGTPPKAEAFLNEGRLAEGEKALVAELAAHPKDDQLRFSLGVLQFLRAVEARAQGLYRHGLRTNQAGGVLSITNLPIPVNDRPEPLDAAGLRAMLQGWVDDLARAEATLAGVTDPAVKLPLHFGLIRMDLDGDGKTGDGETLWRVYARFNRPAQGEVFEKAAREFVIAFDRGDVDWLRGYCHLLSALGELMLAHDFDDLFRNTGYLFFRGAALPYAFVKPPAEGEARPGDFGEVLDLIATIHRMRLPVKDPARLKAVLTHLEATARLSRSSWQAILAETDNDQEWVPNPKQVSVVPGSAVSAEMVKGWTEFLDEFEAILAGRKLLPFWRGNEPGLGVNLRKVLTEPREFDLVLWVQGSAAAPYLERGDVTKPETWQRLNRVFRGEFIGFAMWFN